MDKSITALHLNVDLSSINIKQKINNKNLTKSKKKELLSMVNNYVKWFHFIVDEMEKYLK